MKMSTQVDILGVASSDSGRHVCDDLGIQELGIDVVKGVYHR